MEEFTNRLDKSLFESTNESWNDLFLNSPWSVGYVTDLIHDKPFRQKEHWENYYYESGNRRNILIGEKYQDKEQILNDFTLPKFEFIKFPKNIKEINQTYGRTKSQLAEKGKALYLESIRRKINISEEDCIECVRFRVICQTWNGVVIRERRAIKEMSEILPNVSFEKTTGDFDYKYAVDFEVKYLNRILCGIQIKPPSYYYNRPYTNKARYANKKKNEIYKTEFSRPVFDIIYDNKIGIKNPKNIKEISYLIRK